MGKTKPFEAEKLVVGIMYTDAKDYSAVTETLRGIYGDIDCESEEYSFSDYSKYYNDEMNGTVLKRFVSFRTLVDPSALPAIKHKTNDIEDRLSVNGNRRVNIDPCLLCHGRFIMATTKGASFRIPLSSGMYADLSLVYARNRWVDFFWTYTDIRSDMIKDFLSKVRDIYMTQRDVHPR
ncbi:MAG: DUF4416 family protein [Clostridia bacterium]|nr:DUF4416 family protein [Clostridia bacterium]